MKKQIVLGTFYGQENYNEHLILDALIEDRWYQFGFYRVIPGIDSIGFNSVLEQVEYACKHADVINFVLDDLYLPLDMTLVTPKELHLVLSNEVFLNKTVFWLRKEIVEKEKVVKLVQKVEGELLEFGNIDFKTI